MFGFYTVIPCPGGEGQHILTSSAQMAVRDYLDQYRVSGLEVARHKKARVVVFLVIPHGHIPLFKVKVRYNYYLRTKFPPQGEIWALDVDTYALERVSMTIP